MTARHRQSHQAQRIGAALGGVVALVGAVIWYVAATGSGSATGATGGSAPARSTQPAGSQPAASQAATPQAATPLATTTAPTTDGTPLTPSNTLTASADGPSRLPTRTAAQAHRLVARLTRDHPAGSFSIAVYNPSTDTRFSAGASGGMTVASVIKLDLLEVLLYEHRLSHHRLTEEQRETVAAMIEHSDNAATEIIFDADGGRARVVAMNKRLGLKHTIMGESNLWGLSRSRAADQIILLTHLIDRTSPLTAAQRRYATYLLGHVEADQRWGVSAAHDPHTHWINKNGWLGVDSDGGRWAINSDGIIKVNGQRVLISVLTQHNSGYSSGIAFNESLVRAVATVVAPPR